MVTPPPLYLPGEFLWTEVPDRLHLTDRIGNDWATKHSTQHRVNPTTPNCIRNASQETFEEYFQFSSVQSLSRV